MFAEHIFFISITSDEKNWSINHGFAALRQPNQFDFYCIGISDKHAGIFQWNYYHSFHIITSINVIFGVFLQEKFTFSNKCAQFIYFLC